MDTTLFSEYIPLKSIEITDRFWRQKQELVRTQVIPYQYEALHDRIDGAEASYSVSNFIKAADIVKKLSNGEDVPVYPADKWHYDEANADECAFHGWVFQDSDVYKWIEAVGYSLSSHPDAVLQKKAEDIIDLICSSQMENGYLDTLYIINNRDGIFSNLKDFHELYCFGHLTEAAISFYNSTGDRRLLNAACRFADLICETFGETKIKGYPGHEIAEMALVKLYDVTLNRQYLETARFFINERGKKPYYYDTVLGRTTVEDNYHYNQAHCEPRHQHEAVGHAVRGVYLYSGMADIAKRYRDDELSTACQKILSNIINRKMYITGGIGSTALGEAFSFDYDLPNDLAYSETCASVGLIFFARRMLEIAPDSDTADTVERALYNTVLSGMSEDGRSFFYANPLEVLPEASHKDERKRHIKPTRQKWFGCACCPPNVARLISSIGEYCCTQNDSTVYIHQYIGAKITSSKGRLEILSDYLSIGKICVRIFPEKEFTLAVRIPKWCDSYTFSHKCEIRNGYAYFKIFDETQIDIQFEISVRMIKCSNRVRANIGKIAVTRGPFIYCLEEVDNGADLQMLSIDKNTSFSLDGQYIIAEGYREKDCESLYETFKEAEKSDVKLKFIPYYKWANRGENEMCVYIRAE
ncbi:MAG: glycoside hydrolase family 127 protein [Clostridia bacterium]|nr:glycoside hydrolase family 127 protein [Clostridia bacterium]